MPFRRKAETTAADHRANASEARPSTPAGSAEEQYYYKAAKSWDNDQLRSMQVARNHAYLAALICLLVAAALAAAVWKLAGEHKVEVVTIAYNQETNTVRPVRYTDDVASMTGNEAFVRNQIFQFLSALETWDPADQQNRRSTIALFASKTIESQLIAQMDAESKRRPDALSARVRRGIVVHSMSLLNKTTMHVQFRVEDYLTDQRVLPQEFASIISFQFASRPRTVEEAFVNPFGFEVTGYRKNSVTSPS